MAFDTRYQLTHFTIAAGNDAVGRDPTVWFIEGSNDGTNWTTIFQYNNPGVTPFSARNEVLRYDMTTDYSPPAYYSQFRYRVTQTNGSSLHQIGELEFFGNREVMASYNGALGAPECSVVGGACDSGSLLIRSGYMTPVELSQPNTLDTCLDGPQNTGYLNDESIEKILVSGDLRPGGTANVDVTFHPWHTGTSNLVELYYTGDGDNVSATLTPLATLQPTQGGLQTMSASYTLPAGDLQRIRAIIRFDTSTACSGSGFYDIDDLIFAVDELLGGLCLVGDVATRFQTREAQVISGLQQLDPSVTSLTTEQDQDLNAIYNYYLGECQANPLTVNLLDMEKELLAMIRVFHVDSIFDSYSSRMTLSGELARLEDDRDRASYASIIEEGYGLQQADYVAAAERAGNALRADFQRIIHDRVCQVTSASVGQPCTTTPNPADVHQALFWAGLAYEDFPDITSRVDDGLTQLNVYSSSQMLYQQQEHVNPITHDGLPSFFSNVYARAFVAALDRSDQTTDIVIAFRGTDPASEDAITDIEILLNDYTDVTVAGLDGTPKVHHGFYAMWKAHEQGILDALDTYISGLPEELDNVRTIYVTGHSLGAAVSTVGMPKIATHLQDNYGLNDSTRLKMIHFGSPLTGNDAWTKLFKEKAGLYSYARVWNSLDIVPTIPQEIFGYRHIDSSVKLPTLPDRHLWPHSWWTYWTGIDKARDFWESKGLGDVRHHGIPAYQFNVVRHLINLPVIVHSFWPDAKCVAAQNGALYRTPCDNSLRYACEVLDAIHLNDGGVGVNSISWDSTWVDASTLGNNFYAGNSACIPSATGAVFSAPSSQEDLDAIKDLFGLNSAWVNYEERSFF